MNNDVELNNHKNDYKSNNDGPVSIMFNYIYESLKKCLYYPYDKIENVQQKEITPDFYKSRKDNKYSGISN